MPGDPTWDFQNPASKHRVIGVLQREIDEMFDLVADPACWHIPTACAGWEVRDLIGHLVDATESYLTGFEIARHGGAAPEPVGVAGMARASDDAARAFRSAPRDEMLARLRNDTDQLVGEFESLSDADWTGLVVPDAYMGPLPAMIVVAGMLAGSAVHTWDIRQGLGGPHSLAGDTADLLVPFVFLLWWATAETSAVDVSYTIGIRTTGCNGGDTRIDVTSRGLQIAPAAIDDCSAILECDPATLVLVAYNRVNAGTIRGDRQLVANFRSLFVSI